MLHRSHRRYWYIGTNGTNRFYGRDWSNRTYRTYRRHRYNGRNRGYRSYGYWRTGWC